MRFGLLAGEAHDAATLLNVAVSGVLEIGASCSLHIEHSVGLLIGVGSNHGIDLSGISCKVAEGSLYTASVDPVTGVITLTK